MYSIIDSLLHVNQPHAQEKQLTRTLDSANEYTVAAVTQDFVDGATFDTLSNIPTDLDVLQTMQHNTSLYEHLDVPTCIQQYGVDFLSNRRHVLAVTTGTSLNESDPLLGYMNWNYSAIMNNWVCGANFSEVGMLDPEDINDYDCTIEDALTSLPIYFGNEIWDHCLSEVVPDECRLQFSIPIMCIVILCNLTKLICILLTLLRKEVTLLTLGDAIASFLEYPDPTTRGMCTVSMKDIKSGYWPDDPQPRQWFPRWYFRWHAVGLSRWISSNVL
jgi:hypothetical protein